MAIGRTLEESLHKAIRSLDVGRYGFDDVNLMRKTQECS